MSVFQLTHVKEVPSDKTPRILLSRLFKRWTAAGARVVYIARTHGH